MLMDRSEFLKKMSDGSSLSSLMMGLFAIANVDKAFAGNGSAEESSAKAAGSEMVNPNSYSCVMKKMSLDIAGYYLKHYKTIPKEHYFLKGIVEYYREKVFPLWGIMNWGKSKLILLSFEDDGVVRCSDYALPSVATPAYEYTAKPILSYSLNGNEYHSNFDENLTIVVEKFLYLL